MVEHDKHWDSGDEVTGDASTLRIIEWVLVWFQWEYDSGDLRIAFAYGMKQMTFGKEN